MIIETLAAVALMAGGGQEMAASTSGGGMQERAAPRGDYRDSCSGAYVNRGRLYADCRTNRGQVRGTSIELNRCSDHEIRNNDGLLVCGPYRGDYEDGTGGGGGGGGGGGWPGRGLTVYRDDGFRGSSQTFEGAVSDLGRSGMNDQISSMRMRGEWTTCTDANFRGQCQTFSGDVTNLNRFGMNDRISSVRPGRYDGGGGGGGGGGWGAATVYADALYRGASQTFNREMPDLRNSGMNDRISSIRLQGPWEVCTDANFRGQCQVIREDTWNLQQGGMNDRISSMRPLAR